MLRWLGGFVLLVVLLIASGMWYGYRKLTSFAGGDGPATTVIGASVERVFASLADGDSIPDWMGISGTVRPSRHGRLRPGDTLSVTPQDSSDTRQPMSWIVAEVTPGKLLVLQMRNDSLGVIAATRRYALEARGDSAAILTTVASPMIDSVRTARRDSTAGGAMLNFTSKLMLSAMRMQSQVELMQLKARIEGRPLPGLQQP